MRKQGEFGLFSGVVDRSAGVRMDSKYDRHDSTDEAEHGSDDEGHIEVTAVCVADCRAETWPRQCCNRVAGEHETVICPEIPRAELLDAQRRKNAHDAAERGSDSQDTEEERRRTLRMGQCEQRRYSSSAHAP